MKQLIDESIYCPHKILPENIFIEFPNVIMLEKIIEVKNYQHNRNFYSITEQPRKKRFYFDPIYAKLM